VKNFRQFGSVTADFMNLKSGMCDYSGSEQWQWQLFLFFYIQRLDELAGIPLV